MAHQIHENHETAMTTSEHFLSEIEMQFASNRKVLEPCVYKALKAVAKDVRNPFRSRAMTLVLQAA